MNPGLPSLESLNQLAAAHARHYDVRQDKVDGAGVLLLDLQSFLAVAGGNYVIALILENVINKIQDNRLIFYDQNRFRVAACGRHICPLAWWPARWSGHAPRPAYSGKRIAPIKPDDASSVPGRCSYVTSGTNTIQASIPFSRQVTLRMQVVDEDVLRLG